MHKSLGFFIVMAIGSLGFGQIYAATLDCTAMDAQRCTVQPTSLKSNTFSSVEWTTPSPCCLYNCATNALHPVNDTKCVCKAGYYLQKNNDNDCTACPTGTFNDSNTINAQCTVCEGGKYNTGVGNTVCDQTCPTIAQASGYISGKWNNGETVKTCLVNTCNPGYHPAEDKTKCEGNKYTVKVYDGAKEIKSVQCTFGTTCSFEIEPQKSGSIFSGWALTNNGTPSFAITWLKGLPATWTPYTGTYPAIPGDNATINIYATWTNCTNEGATNAKEWDGNKCVIKTCNAGYYVHDTPDTDPVKNGCYTCPAGYYCPGENDGCSYTGSTDTNPHGICDCARGYYCPSSSGTGTACPMGTTTTSARATTSARCVMMMGDNGTKFCDSTGGCFTLPGTGSITATGR